MEHLGFGYICKRIAAYLLDSAINIAVCVLALSTVFWKQGLNPEVLLNPAILLLSSLFLLIFNWALITAQEVAFGTSLGKRMFNLALHGGAGVIFARALLFLISASFCGVGLLWALFKRNKRCWHDAATGIQPAEIATL